MTVPVNIGFLDRCVFVAAASGSATFTVASAVTGYQTPLSAGAVNGAQYAYAAQSSDLTQWEYGYGTYSATGPTLTRTVLASTNFGSVVSFTVIPQVTITVLAETTRNLLTATWLYKTANYNAAVFDQILADTTSGTFTVTLPASPAVGYWLALSDPFNTWGTANLTVAGNSSDINSSASNFICDVGGQNLTFMYVGSPIGWKVIVQ